MEVNNATSLLKAHLEYFIEDADKWLKLFAEEAIMEYPYASSIGLHAVLKGVEEIKIGRSSFLEMFDNPPVFKPVKIYDLAKDLAYGEYELIGNVTATGKEYHQLYGGILQSQDGKILLFREYYNPVKILNAFNGINSLTLENK